MSQVFVKRIDLWCRRYWMLVSGCLYLDAGCWMLVSGCLILDAGYWMLDAGYWMLDTGF